MGLDDEFSIQDMISDLKKKSQKKAEPVSKPAPVAQPVPVNQNPITWREILERPDIIKNLIITAVVLTILVFMIWGFVS